MEKTRVAAYCRVSTEKEDQLLSLRNQKQFFEEYAEKQGYELVEVYADEGLSGTKLKNRRAFARLMDDAAAGRFERVFVKDVSRLSRNVVDFLQSVRRLRALGVDCKFITSGMSLNDGELTLTILAAVAQEESANLSKRVKFGKKKNAAQGRVPNLIYGYDKAPGDYFSLQINAHEAEVVRQVFEWYAAGEYGTGRIARLLNGRGECTKRGCAWSQAAVRRLLSHRVYIGEVVNGREYVADYLTGRRARADETDWHIVQNPALAIVDRPLFERVQALLAGRSDAFAAAPRHRQYPLSGLIRCACCGQAFRRLVRRTGASQMAKWVCGGRSLNGADTCPNRTALPEAELLGAIAAYLRETLDGHGLQQAARLVERERAAAQPDSAAAARTLARIERAKQRQMTLFEAEAVTLEEFRARMETLRREEEEARRTAARAPDPAEPACAAVSAALLSPEGLDGPLLHRLVERIEVSEDGTAVIRLNRLQ
ncbi:MAG: recombinase family protein [Intestinibacillus sp.]